MKQMNAYKKSLMVLAFSFFAVTGALAQFSIGGELALPMGDFGTAYNMGFGASATYEGSINDNLSWTGYFGYLSYGGKDAFSGSTWSIIPIMGGVRYYFTEKGAGFYGEADLGVFLNSISASGVSASETKFGLTPALGYRVGSFDLGARYNINSDASFLSFRVAYCFGGSK